jgi:hypothetical protein
MRRYALRIKRSENTAMISTAFNPYRRDAAIAIAAILEGERRDVGGQRRFAIRSLGDFVLCGTMLTKDSESPSL